MQKKILIVDDDIGLLKALTIVLERENYIIEAVETGKHLLNGMTLYPDLIILDKQLSGMDGAEICRQLKMQKSTKHIPVILMSATSNLECIAKDAGADNFVEKPFSIQDLLVMVNHMIYDR